MAQKPMQLAEVHAHASHKSYKATRKKNRGDTFLRCGLKRPYDVVLAAFILLCGINKYCKLLVAGKSSELQLIFNPRASFVADVL